VSESPLVRAPVPGDLAAIARLHADLFGPGRFARTAYRVREGTAAITPLCRVAYLGSELVAALRMTPVGIGGREGVQLLGPLAVAAAHANRGHGRALVRDSLEAAAARGDRLVVLVGDVSYYARLGFAPVQPGHIQFPGPVDPARILARELVAGALADYRGRLEAAAMRPKESTVPLVQ
jgi:predicted N-acetyltransferase YhbS